MNSHTNYQQVRFGSGSRVTHAVQRLILLTCATFALQLIVDIPFGRSGSLGGMTTPGGIISTWLAFRPDSVMRGALWRPFTYLFLHGGLMHLFFNMLMLFFFGPDVERALGTRAFYRFYFACGVLGVFATFVRFGDALAPISVVGASGAVMGVMVAFAMVNPDRKIFLFPFPVPISARALVIILIAFNLYTALRESGGGTSWQTHLGGMFVGYLCMKSVPLLLQWRRAQLNRKSAAKTHTDKVGEAVNNIFKFNDKKRH